MEIDSFMIDFEKHAKSELFNGDEVTSEALEEVKKQLIDVVGSKNPPRWAVVEFATYRLKKYLKIAVNDEEWLLFEKALKAIENVQDESGNTNGLANYKLAAV